MTKKKEKRIRAFLMIIISLYILIYIIFNVFVKDTSYAGTVNASESDVQLIARAINRRSKRRKL